MPWLDFDDRGYNHGNERPVTSAADVASGMHHKLVITYTDRNELMQQLVPHYVGSAVYSPPFLGSEPEPLPVDDVLKRTISRRLIGGYE